MKEKICKYCLKDKPLDEFGINKAMALGISNKCKKCSSEYTMFRYSVNNIYKESTLEYEIYEYFCRHRVHIPPEAMESIIERFREGSFWRTLSQIEEEYETNKDMYVPNLRDERNLF